MQRENLFIWTSGIIEETAEGPDEVQNDSLISSGRARCMHATDRLKTRSVPRLQCPRREKRVARHQSAFVGSDLGGRVPGRGNILARASDVTSPDVRAAATPPTAAATAGEARDDNVEEGDDGADDGLKHGADAVDDGHQAGTDGAEERGNLRRLSVFVIPYTDAAEDVRS